MGLENGRIFWFEAPVRRRLLVAMLAAVLAVSALPTVLSLAGVDLGEACVARLHLRAHLADEPAIAPALGHPRVSGTLVHALFEWSSLAVAGLVALLGLPYLTFRRHPVTPLLGLLLLGVAIVEGAHVVVADRLAGTVGGEHLFALSWSVGRSLGAALLIAGVGSLLVAPRLYHPVRIALLAGLTAALVALAFAGTGWLAASGFVAVRPDATLSRPLDLGPLLLYACSVPLVWRLARRVGGLFTVSLVIAAAPSLGAQVHMALGSSVPFDEHFIAAHLLKLVASATPLVGLAFEYVSAHLDANRLVGRLEAEKLERGRMADAVRQGELRLRAVLDNIVDGIVTVDERGRIVAANPAIERLFGHPHEELVGENVRVLMPEPHRSVHDSYIQRYLRTGKSSIMGTGREVVGRRRDGSLFPLELSLSEARVDGTLLFTGVLRDISERKRVERMKDEFISTVSHELRTPLTSIRGSLGLLAGGAVEPLSPKLQAMIEIARSNCDRLVRLINEILDIEKIESGNVSLTIRPTEVMPLVHSALKANEPYAADLGVTLGLAGGVPGAWVSADGDRIVQVLTNMLSNAAKFSPRGSEVSVRVSRAGGHCIRFEVADRGPGVPEAFRDRVFDKFAQADATDTRERSGTGLGLSICKAIVERHGGRIGFDSVEGRGATFWFELAEWRPCGKAGPGAEPRGLGRVLVCEDDALVARTLALTLQRWGFTTEVACSAREAESLLGRQRFDAMTLDIALPDGDGLELLERLRAREATRSLPVVVISAHGSHPQRLETSALAVVDWVRKPVDLDRLREAVRSAVAEGEERLPRVLHVEDDPDIRRMVAETLAGQVRLVQVHTVAGAREALAQTDFDVVVLDVRLPDGSGLDLLPVRGRDGQGLVPVVVLAGEELPRDAADDVAAALVKSRTSLGELRDTIAANIELGAAARAAAAGASAAAGRASPGDG